MLEDMKMKLESGKVAEGRIRALITQLEDQASTWAERAELAFRKGCDDLAQEALGRRAECLRHRKELSTRLAESESASATLEELLRLEAKETIMSIAREIESTQQDIQGAQTLGNSRLVSLLEERIDDLLEKGRQVWEVAFPGSEPPQAQRSRAWERGAQQPDGPVMDLYSQEIDLELEHLKRKIDGRNVK